MNVNDRKGSVSAGQYLDGRIFAALLRGGAAGLYARKATVNDLNVFPVPDGDTGDNLYMTIASGASRAADAVAKGKDLAGVSSCASEGMLLGARGNSGVILSRFFAGIAEGLAMKETATSGEIASAFAKGVEKAYGAVTKPVEGTMLTVCREAVAFAAKKTDGASPLENYLDALIAEAKRSLARTPDLLKVLKDAGVVDSGGAGLVFIFEGMQDALLLHGDFPEEQPTTDANGDTRACETKEIDLSGFGPDSVLEYGYCTEFLLRLQNAKLGGDYGNFDTEGFIAWLNRVGNSVVAFRDGSVVKVHVHTNAPGDILNECQKYGEFLTLKIENMTLQHNETATTAPVGSGSVPAASDATKDEGMTLRYGMHKSFGTVAVAAGEGIRATFLELGIDRVVDGGQCMNPSAGDFVEAFRQIDADTILVLPNNGNVILTARQAAGIYMEEKPDVKVEVIGTKTVGEGYAVVSMLDTSSGDLQTILDGARDAMAGVVTGQVAVASRDTERDGLKIGKGDYLGFTDDGILSRGADRCEALLGLCEKLDAGTRDVLILICGADATPEEADALYGELTKRYRRTETIVLDGGQPVYDFILVLE